jgi:acyl-coenzyme A synthetase/AMP-(fatty) acid ligase
LIGIRDCLREVVQGELLVSGLLARVYLNDELKTKERFVVLNIPELTSWKMKRRYATGNLVRLDVDRHVIFLGRGNKQVKRAGIRLELGEVEAVLANTNPECGIFAAALLEGDELAYFFVPIYKKEDAGRGNLTALSMISALEPMKFTLSKVAEESLPSYIVPSLFIPITTMPIATSTKLDYQALKPLTKILRLINSRVSEPLMKTMTSKATQLGEGNNSNRVTK